MNPHAHNVHDANKDARELPRRSLPEKLDLIVRQPIQLVERADLSGRWPFRWCPITIRLRSNRSTGSYNLVGTVILAHPYSIKGSASPRRHPAPCIAGQKPAINRVFLAEG
jgi:hypothetical protein